MKATTKVGVWLGAIVTGALGGCVIGLFFMLMEFLESWSPKLWGAIAGVIAFVLIRHLIKEQRRSR
jgi:hypothetical protein